MRRKNGTKHPKALASRIGYEKTLQLCASVLKKPIDFLTIPDNAESMLAMREAVNTAIESFVAQ